MILAIMLVISGYRVWRWLSDNWAITQQARELEELGAVTEVDEAKSSQTSNSSAEPNDNFYDYNNVKLINANFAELKNLNPDVKGWLKVDGTNVNYPFVQSNDNNYYLNHAFNRNTNGAGWIFLDYRSDPALQDNHQIIYAHGRQNGTMFGSLKNVLTETWFQDYENHFIKISTETENSLWQIFSTYKIPTTSDYLKVDFENNQEFRKFIDILKKRSAHNFDASLVETDRVVTLSTCYNANERLVIHAKLVKRIEKE